MPRTDEDEMHAGPRVMPARDEIASYKAKKTTRPAKQVKAGMGSGAKFFLFLAFLLAAAAAAGSSYLYLQLTAAQEGLENAQQRVGELENRLSSTDESVSESGVAMQVKIKELTSEVDKLWASAWRKNKATLEALSEQVNKQQQANASQAKTLSTQTQVVEKLQSQLGDALAAASDLKNIRASAFAQEAQLSEVSDRLRNIDSGVRSLSKRMTETEGWVDSFNAYRRQVNSEIAELERAVQALQQSQAGY